MNRRELVSSIATRVATSAAPESAAFCPPTVLVPTDRPEPAPRPPSTVPVASLRFRQSDQPRDMLPAEVWDRLASSGRDDPASALAALEEVARSDRDAATSRAVLQHVRELALTIPTLGVLLPLTIVRDDGHYCVVDGHCRAMAAASCGLEAVPVTDGTRARADGIAGELEKIGKRFVLNSTQQKLRPIEAMQEVTRLYELAQALVEASSPPDGDLDESPRARGRTRQADQAAKARDLVVEHTGLSETKFRALLTLRNLSDEAIAEARRAEEPLGEEHLRAIAAAPRETQQLLVQLVVLQKASVAVTRRHCEAAKDGGIGAVAGLYADALRQRERSSEARTAISWRSLLNAVPEDITPRVSALRAEVEALPERSRDKRLRAIELQRDRLVELTRCLDEILLSYGRGPASADVISPEDELRADAGTSLLSAPLPATPAARAERH